MKTYFNPFYKAILALLLVCMFIGPVQANHNTYPRIFYLMNGRNSTEIPFQMVNNLIIIPVMLDGKKKLNFILDTGASSPIIFNRKYIKGLNLSLGRDVSFYGAGNGKAVTGQVINNVALHLSGAATDRLGMVVLDKNPFQNLIYDGITIHGAIGSILFKCFIVEIDFQHDVLRLFKQESFVACQAYEILPLDVQFEKPLIKASVCVAQTLAEVNLMIDTGFNNSLLLYDKNEQFHIPAKRRFRKIGVGYSGTLSSSTGLIEQLSIGRHTVHGVYTIFPKTGHYDLKTDEEFVERHGTLGIVALKDFDVIFDYTGHKFYIKDAGEEQKKELIVAELK